MKLGTATRHSLRGLIPLATNFPVPRKPEQSSAAARSAAAADAPSDLINLGEPLPVYRFRLNARQMPPGWAVRLALGDDGADGVQAQSPRRSRA